MQNKENVGKESFEKLSFVFLSQFQHSFPFSILKIKSLPRPSPTSRVEGCQT
jgi:hypothetical protein